MCVCVKRDFAANFDWSYDAYVVMYCIGIDEV